MEKWVNLFREITTKGFSGNMAKRGGKTSLELEGDVKVLLQDGKYFRELIYNINEEYTS